MKLRMWTPINVHRTKTQSGGIQPCPWWRWYQGSLIIRWGLGLKSTLLYKYQPSWSQVERNKRGAAPKLRQSVYR